MNRRHSNSAAAAVPGEILPARRAAGRVAIPLGLPGGTTFFA